MTETTEVRRLRAAIYGDVSDTEWLLVKSKWTQTDNLFWLRQNQPRCYTPCPPGMHWKKWHGHPDAPGSLE